MHRRFQSAVKKCIQVKSVSLLHHHRPACIDCSPLTHSQGIAAHHHYSYSSRGPSWHYSFSGESAEVQRSQPVFPAQGLVTVDQDPKPRSKSVSLFHLIKWNHPRDSAPLFFLIYFLIGRKLPYSVVLFPLYNNMKSLHNVGSSVPLFLSFV